jgi:hypothetical protein
VRDVRALARVALSVVRPEDPAPEPLPTAIRGLARATETLAAYLETSGDPDDTRRLALEAAREASALLTEREDLARSMSANALVDQIHSTVVDILGSTGMDRGNALQVLEEATGRITGPGQDGAPKGAPPRRRNVPRSSGSGTNAARGALGSLRYPRDRRVGGRTWCKVPGSSAGRTRFRMGLWPILRGRRGGSERST